MINCSLDDKFVDIFKGKLPNINELYTINDNVRSKFTSKNITECDRRIVYSIYDNSKSNLYDIMEQEACRDKWLKILKKYSTIQILSEKHVSGFNDCGLSIFVDAILRINTLRCTIMFKSVSMDKFNHLSNKNIYRSHILDIMMQCWVCELNHGFILYENSNDLSYKIYHVEISMPHVKSVVSKFSKLYDCKLNGIIPDRPYKDSSGKECSVCEFKTKCWQ